MTQEQVQKLLQPRYLVINNYPDCDKNKHFVGTIIHFDSYDKKYKQWKIVRGTTTIYDAYFDNYPHLFRKLEWWEERDVVDMPKYLKWIKRWPSIPSREIGDVMVADKWISNTHFVSEGEGWKLTGKWYEPASSEEYIDYKQQTK